jgi:hypothetical protein
LQAPRPGMTAFPSHKTKRNVPTGADYSISL